jgi:hypothetical protein
LFGVALALNFSANKHSKPMLLGYKINTYLGLSLGFRVYLGVVDGKERKKERKSLSHKLQ